MNKTLASAFTLVITSALAGSLITAAPANAAGDGRGNTFDIRESTVHVVGNRPATIHYRVDGWSAGWDADDLLGSAYVETHGVVGWDIESYDWWDWSVSDWDNLTWSGSRQIYTKQDTTKTARAEFDVFDDFGGYRDGYSTVVRDSVRVDYHPVKVKASNTKHAVRVKVQKDGKPFRNVKVSGKGVTRKTNAKGIAKLPKRALPRGKWVTFKVGGNVARARIRVTR